MRWTCDSCGRGTDVDANPSGALFGAIICPACATQIAMQESLRKIAKQGSNDEKSSQSQAGPLRGCVTLVIILGIMAFIGSFMKKDQQPAQPAVPQKAAPDLSRFTFMPLSPMPAQIRPGGTTTVRLQVSRKGDFKCALTFQVLSHSLNDLVVEDPIGPLQLTANQDFEQFSVRLRATPNAQLGERAVEIKATTPVSENESLKIRVNVTP